MKLRSKQTGISLMELMVGMVLGLIVVAGAVAVYLASSRSYSEVEQSAQLSENSRFTEQVLTDALRHAGFMGEAAVGEIEVPGSLGAIIDDCDTGTRAGAYFLGTPIYAVIATSDSSDPDIGCISDDAENNALEDTEVLIIKSAIPFPISDGPRDVASAVAKHNNSTLDYPDGSETRLPGKLWLLTNNVIGEMFDGDNTPPFTEIPPDTATAWEYRYEAYFIRDVRDADGKLMPRLSRFVLSEDSVTGSMALITEDLVPDVEDMRMRFGLDTRDDTGAIGSDGEVDIYATVAEMNATDAFWDQIVSIEIALLVSSAQADPNYTDANTYDLAGFDDITAPASRAQHRRLVVRSNVSLRNIKFVIRGG